MRMSGVQLNGANLNRLWELLGIVMITVLSALKKSPVSAGKKVPMVGRPENPHLDILPSSSLQS